MFYGRSHLYFERLCSLPNKKRLPSKTWTETRQVGEMLNPQKQIYLTLEYLLKHPLLNCTSAVSTLEVFFSKHDRYIK